MSNITSSKNTLNQVKFEYIPSSDNIADLFTKPLLQDAVRKLVTRLNITQDSRNVPLQEEY